MLLRMTLFRDFGGSLCKSVQCAYTVMRFGSLDHLRANHRFQCLPEDPSRRRRSAGIRQGAGLSLPAGARWGGTAILGRDVVRQIVPDSLIGGCIWVEIERGQNVILSPLLDVGNEFGDANDIEPLIDERSHRGLLELVAAAESPDIDIPEHDEERCMVSPFDLGPSGIQDR
jgi:hypothetical protein